MNMGAGDVIAHLRNRKLLGADETATVERLSGGVSSDVFRVDCDDRALVVKKPLSTLRVARRWEAPVERVELEAIGMRLASDLSPATVPELIDLDSRAHVLVMSCAPDFLSNWKMSLLSAVPPDVATATALGSNLARWHAGTTGAPLPRTLTEPGRSFFRSLRILPFHETVSAAHPTHASLIKRAISDLEAPGTCLVHGDFSPKNILAHGSNICVLDWEAAHLGAPVFDVAFMASHLVLKGLRSQHDVGPSGIRAVWSTFARAYGDAWPMRPFSEEDLGRHAACLILARVDGLSVVEYLSPPQQSRARQLALGALEDELTVSQMWESLG